MWVLKPSLLAIEYFGLMETVIGLFDGQGMRTVLALFGILARDAAHHLSGYPVNQGLNQCSPTRTGVEIYRRKLEPPRVSSAVVPDLSPASYSDNAPVGQVSSGNQKCR
jgi:hypothetical protein